MTWAVVTATMEPHVETMEMEEEDLEEEEGGEIMMEEEEGEAMGVVVMVGLEADLKKRDIEVETLVEEEGEVVVGLALTASKLTIRSTSLDFLET
jgi:hypothetical protein